MGRGELIGWTVAGILALVLLSGGRERPTVRELDDRPPAPAPPSGTLPAEPPAPGGPAIAAPPTGGRAVPDAPVAGAPPEAEPSRVPAAPGPEDPFALKGLEAIDPAKLDDIREPAEIKVDAVLERHRLAESPEEKAKILKGLSVPLHSYLGAGGDARHLPYLAAIAESGATAAERKEALLSVHALSRVEVVDYLLERTRSVHPEVRFYAYEGLCWVKGKERDRALEGAQRGLEDEDAEVRGITAIGLTVIARDERRVPALLERLGRETDGKTAGSIAAGLLKFDTPGIRESLERVRGVLGEEAGLAVEEALKAKGK